MLRALYTAASGMSAQQLNLDNIANNLANSSTSGFYSRRLQFSDLVYQNVIMPGAASTQETTIAAGLLPPNRALACAASQGARRGRGPDRAGGSECRSSTSCRHQAL